MPVWFAAVCLAGGLKQPFEYVVAQSSETNERNSEGDMLEFRDGRLMLAWTDFYTSKGTDWGPSRISARISKDRGKTWGEKFTLQENIGRMNVMEADLLRLRSGKVLFLFARKNSAADCQPMVRLSSDDGKTFSAPKPMPIEPAPSYTGFNHDRAIQLGSGRILMPLFYTTDYRVEPHIRSRVYYSDDEGSSWKPGKTILDVPDDKAGAQEPGVVELQDGRILLWVRTDKGTIYRAYSNDRGETFTQPEPMELDSPLSPQSIKRIPSTGDLLLLWNYSTRGRFPLTAAISKDEGKTWGNFHNLDQDPFHSYAYTSIQFLKDRALFTYYAGPPVVGKGDRRWSLKLKATPLKWFYDPKVIVTLGDSVTFGIRWDGSVKYAETFSSLLERDLQKSAPGAHVVNAGIGGNTSSQMLARLDHDVLVYRPKVVVLMAGLNDAAYIDAGPTARSTPRVAVADYARNLEQIIRRVRESGARVVLASPNPMTARYPFANFGWYKGKDINSGLTAYVEASREVGRRTGVPFVDLYQAYKSWNRFEATLPDGVHPNAEGHAFVAARFLPECRKALKK